MFLSALLVIWWNSASVVHAAARKTLDRSKIAPLDDEVSNQLNSLIPTFTTELLTLRERVSDVLNVEKTNGDPEVEAELIAQTVDEVWFENDDNANEVFQRAMEILSEKKDHLRGNNCTDPEIISSLIEARWTNSRLKILSTLYIRDLSSELQKLRRDIMSRSRKAISQIERHCVTKFRRKLHSEGPQPEFNPDLPGWLCSQQCRSDARSCTLL